MPYTAEDIARVLIQKYIDLKSPTTNMKLQKVLYYAWVEYYKEKREYLFKDSIYAWKFGPVVASVYYNYRIYAALPITKCKLPDSTIGAETIRFLYEFAEKYKDRTASGLTYITHREGTPWHEVYKEGEKDTVIPFKRIVELECR